MFTNYKNKAEEDRKRKKRKKDTTQPDTTDSGTFSDQTSITDVDERTGEEENDRDKNE